MGSFVSLLPSAPQTPTFEAARQASANIAATQQENQLRAAQTQLAQSEAQELQQKIDSDAALNEIVSNAAMGAAPTAAQPQLPASVSAIGQATAPVAAPPINRALGVPSAVPGLAAAAPPANPGNTSIVPTGAPAALAPGLVGVTQGQLAGSVVTPTASPVPKVVTMGWVTQQAAQHGISVADAIAALATKGYTVSAQ
jgi:hypothetical protein